MSNLVIHTMQAIESAGILQVGDIVDSFHHRSLCHPNRGSGLAELFLVGGTDFQWRDRS